MAEKRRAGAGVTALAIFAGWMWHAAETADPGITERETTKAANTVAGTGIGVLNEGRSAAQASGLGNVLTAPPADAAGAGQLGGVEGE